MWGAEVRTEGTDIPLSNASLAGGRLWIQMCSGAWYDIGYADFDLLDASGAVLKSFSVSYSPRYDDISTFGCKDDWDVLGRGVLTKYPTARTLRVADRYPVIPQRFRLVSLNLIFP